VATLAARLGLGFVGRRTPVETGGDLEARARRVRYAALRALAKEVGASRIVTAHTLDDQAETVLLRLLRGTGPAGLGGIPERSPDGRVVRPLLGVARAEIERFARARGLVWREDASNRDPAYARARLRRDWLHGLGEAFNPRWLRAIGDLAEAQRRESEWTEPLVEQEAAQRLVPDGGGWTLACAGWDRLPSALARRLARRALFEAGAGRDVTRVHLERMLAFVSCARTGATLELPGGLRLVRERGRVRLCPGRAQRGC
jgi:tRNA(Ile)-lysidine synthase